MQNELLLSDLFSHWERQRHLTLAPNLSPSEITAFETRNGVSVPADFSQYLRHANGFKALIDDSDLEASDDEGFEFYPLLEEHLITKRYLVFCGWPYGFLRYAVCVDKAAENGAVVQVIDENRGRLLATNFLAFVSLYLVDSELLYSAGTEVVSLR
ncbi:MAG: SMI1/KNR4 family protein [Alphaproteobacteria bacterium]|nr:MAG: SMI1/KNR4 family protein [Alphaproteobacteria bacterium]